MACCVYILGERDENRDMVIIVVVHMGNHEFFYQYLYTVYRENFPTSYCHPLCSVTLGEFKTGQKNYK